MPAATFPLLPLAAAAAAGLAAAGALSPAERVEAALNGAMVADVLASRSHRSYDAAAIQAAYGGKAPAPGQAPQAAREALERSFSREEPWQPTECGHELAASLEAVSSQGFELESFVEAWQTWAESYQGFRAPATEEALQSLAAGAPASAAGSHFIDLAGAVRLPALLPLLERAGDGELAAAGREMLLPTHGNPKVLQAAEFLLRAALKLLRAPPPHDSGAARREAVVAALRGAAEGGGRSLLGVVEEAVAEAHSRDAFTAAAAAGPGAADGAGGALADAYSDLAVLGRLTASGAQSGTEVEGGKSSYIMPAIIWLVVAYDSFSDAVLANALLGGESAVRAIFVGLLLASRDGPSAIPTLWATHLLPHRSLPSRPPPAFKPALRLCGTPGACHLAEGWAEELRLQGVAVAAAIARPRPEPRGPLERYRMFVRVDASELLGAGAADGALTKPPDWDDAEDGDWEPEEVGPSKVACLARYLQFTSAGGRHAPFGLWPAEAMCQLTRRAPVAHESFDVVLAEPLAHVIGGIVLGSEAHVVKLPRLSVDDRAEAPSWSNLCEHLGTIRLPEGRWDLAREGSASARGVGEL